MNISRRFAQLASAFCMIGVLSLTACMAENKPAEMEAAPETEMAMEETMPAVATKLNVNTASKDEFLTIPGVGDRMVREFDEYRPYTSIKQFRQEIGKYVDEAQVAEYEKYIFVPVDPNSSDDETVMQLPGVDESVIEELNLAKPFISKDAFLETVSTYIT
ncbi:MAG: hypothetical protein HKN13_12260, partial [Rhodothermales bacterium]|nr:hypothetical protein [Rhodothermales bacterium]